MAFDFIAELPWRPKKPERTFVCIVPDPAAARAIARTALSIATEADLADRLVSPERYHLSLTHISDRNRLRSRDEFAVGRAARLVELAAFELSFSKAGSVRGPPQRGRPPKHPLVLLADDGAIHDLFRALGSELRKLRIAVGEYFSPHITLAYSEQFVRMRAVEPIRFTVREFVLIHSERGRAKYNILGTWALN